MRHRTIWLSTASSGDKHFKLGAGVAPLTPEKYEEFTTGKFEDIPNLSKDPSCILYDKPPTNPNLRLKYMLIVNEDNILFNINQLFRSVYVSERLRRQLASFTFNYILKIIKL